MGCCYSAAVDLAKIENAQFVGLPVCWSGLANVTGEVNLVKTRKNSSTLQDSAGNVLLNVEVNEKANFVQFIDPRTGNTVVLLGPPQRPSLFSKKPVVWSVWTAEPIITGAISEGTPIGVAMYRLGFFKKSKATSAPLEFVDSSPNETKLSMVKQKSGSDVVVYSPDGTHTAAVIQKIRWPAYSRGKCTFAKGVDPVVSILMAMSIIDMNAEYAAPAV